MSLMCVYEDCLSVKYPCSKMAFFRLPTDDRRSTWIRNSGNKSLLKIGPKAHRFFCENHFRERDISSQFNRKLLRRDAVPIEHPSLDASQQVMEEDSISIETTNEQKITNENKEIVEILEENTDYQNLYEELKVLDSSTSDTPAVSNSDVPYRLLGFYEDDNEEPSTASIFVATADEDATKTIENPRRGRSLEIYLEENSENNQVDSSTLELEEQDDSENIETLDYSPKECEVPAKKKRPNEVVTPIEIPTSAVVQIPTPNNNSYEEDKHFALSLVGYFQRLPQGKKSLAKLKILQYLTNLEIDLPASF